VPKLGGLVLLLGIVPALATRLGSPHALALLAGWLIAFGAGLADDRWHLRPRLKFALQILASAATVVPFFWLEGTPAFAGRVPDALVLAIGVIWVTAFQNAVNFLDNMDGITTGVAAIALIGLAIVIGPGAAREFAVVVALACAGFLPWNVTKPARIYLGDAGSLPLGHAVGACGWLALAQAPHLGAAAAVLPLVAIPIFDLTFVTVVRLSEGRSPAQGGRDHTTHRLFARIGSVSRTRAWFWSGGGLLAALGVVLQHAPVPLSIGVVLLRAAGAGVGARWFAGLPTPEATARQN
jgi:UDP-GlcNAc:undecaprenyl-phosphate GlcNAc-1-phosphate transferase